MGLILGKVLADIAMRGSPRKRCRCRDKGLRWNARCFDWKRKQRKRRGVEVPSINPVPATRDS